MNEETKKLLCSLLKEISYIRTHIVDIEQDAIAGLNIMEEEIEKHLKKYEGKEEESVEPSNISR